VQGVPFIYIHHFVPNKAGLRGNDGVQVYHNGQWGTVCHDGWGMDDAKVACRQLGFTKAVGYWWHGQGKGKVWLNWIGNRLELDTRLPANTPLRYHSGQWGTVCQDYWGMDDAKVACRQLGFTKTVGYWYEGRGTGKVWLWKMQCTGTETSLASCTHNGWGSVASYCPSHNYDVGVVCVGFNV
jgi:hypothetical protein